MILAGDVGGTKVHLALYDFTVGRLHPIRDQKFPAHRVPIPFRLPQWKQVFHHVAIEANRGSTPLPHSS